VPKSDLPIGPDYAPVADRVALFYERFPSGRIITHLALHNEHEIMFRATVYRDERSRWPAATGWASERVGDGDINTVACLENTETSAIGRALANLGFTASKNRPSAEEMVKAARAHPRRVAEPRSLPNDDGRVIRAGNWREPNLDTERQARANAAMDVIRRLRVAQRLGLDAKRVDRFYARVTEPDVSDRDLDRLDRALLSWLSKHGETRFLPR
jgi:hypothetical protein